MIKNILLYLVVLLSVFVFSIFYTEWFSWYLLLVVLCIPVFSLVFSLPFMIVTAVRGLYVTVPKEITVGEKLNIGVSCCNGKGFFCPLMKINFKLSNDFSHYKKCYKFLYGGFSEKTAYKKTNAPTRSCGCLKIKAKYAKLYDMLGIFFIPVKLNFISQFLVMPKEEKPKVLPSVGNELVVGYKPKPSGFADEYELRTYQNGDSLKNIHWKISAKYDDLVVKEPTAPVYRPYIIKPIITNNVTENNRTFAKLAYTMNYLKNSKADVYLCNSDGKLIKINSDDDFKEYILNVYQKKPCDYGILNCEENAITYTITHSSEAVSA